MAKTLTRLGERLLNAAAGAALVLFSPIIGAYVVISWLLTE